MNPSLSKVICPDASADISLDCKTKLFPLTESVQECELVVLLIFIHVKLGLNPSPDIELALPVPVYNLFAKLSAKVGALLASEAKAI